MSKLILPADHRDAPIEAALGALIEGYGYPRVKAVWDATMARKHPKPAGEHVTLLAALLYFELALKLKPTDARVELARMLRRKPDTFAKMMSRARTGTPKKMEGLPRDLAKHWSSAAGENTDARRRFFRRTILPHLEQYWPRQERRD